MREGRMRGKRRIFAAIFAVVLGITGVAIASGGSDPEITGTSTSLSFTATRTKSQDCLDRNNQPTGDKLNSYTLDGMASGGEDPALNGHFSARVRELVDQDGDNASAGFYSISNPNNGPHTFAGFGALDRSSGEQSNPPKGFQDAALSDTDRQGFTIGKSYANGQTRLLFGTLSFNLENGDGVIGREDQAGDDAALISGFCDVNRDGRDDFDGEHSMESRWAPPLRRGRSSYLTVNVPCIAACRWPGTVQKNVYLPGLRVTLNEETLPPVTIGPLPLTPLPWIAMSCGVEEAFLDAMVVGPPLP